MKKEPIKIVTLVVVAAVLISGTYYLGFQKGLDETKNIIIENVLDIDTPDEVAADFNLFWEVWEKLQTEHIDGSKTNEQDLVYGAINGLVNAFGDPNTVFFSPEESKKFNDDIKGNFSGIGAEIGIRDDKLTVIAPLKNTPAEIAGLLPGDHILQIDGEITDGITIESAVQKIRGDLGSIVTLTIIREGWDNSKKFEITRANIQVPNVEWDMIDGNIIHLKLFKFSGNSVSDFQSAILAGLRGGGDGLILDLRGNPGGLLDVSVRIAGFFLERGQVVVTEKFVSDEDIVLRATGNGALKDFPVVILINGGSASASEILAGALRVHNGTQIIGTQSFGKGTVQELNDLSNKSTLKITIANWLLPDGTLIEGNGLEPDIIVEITDEDITAERDSQLEKAVEVLKQSL